MKLCLTKIHDIYNVLLTRTTWPVDIVFTPCYSYPGRTSPVNRSGALTMDSKVETIAGELRQRIKSGEFGRAGRIPPQRALCDYYNVSRDTINRAIKILEAEGLLVTQGKSTYTHLPIRLPAFVSNYDDYIRARGLEPISEFIEPPNMVTPPFLGC